MSNKDQNNTPAFPSANAEGMTLRDYFAGQAMQAELTARILAYYQGHESADYDTYELADLAYSMADKMLISREA
jgi:hypothetical protein